jgi:hypothetical protein
MEEPRSAPLGVLHALLLGASASSSAGADAAAASSSASPPPPSVTQEQKQQQEKERGGSVASASSSAHGGKKRKAPPPTPTAAPTTAASASEPPMELDVVLPGGTQGIRAAMLARNWVRRVGNRVQGRPGEFMAVLLDRGRVVPTIVTELERTVGYDPQEHDPVIFFERRGRRLAGSFGAVLRGSGQLWSPQAYRDTHARDASAAWAFQVFLETDAFNWLECDRCGKWRLYPHDDVTLPGEGEGAVFFCEMAGTWNPAVKGCATEQEYSFDSAEAEGAAAGGKEEAGAVA